MPSEDTKILEFNQCKKSDKAPLVIYVDLKCSIEKIDGCKNNAENSSTTKLGKHIPSGFSMPTISSFKSIKNKHYVWRGKDCIKKFGESLTEHAMGVCNLKRKNEVSNKRTEGNIWKCENLLYLQRKTYK